ncbi:MAG TPA: hypothetical protein VGR53_09155 [Nitrososphaerales archaeon]|nr:hypothetical protein [Nitrososphaerales archaeon]
MPIYCGALPVLPGKRVALMQFVKDITGPMRKDFEHSQKHLGVKKLSWFIQSSAESEWFLIYFESNEVARVFGDFAVSKDPFEVLMRNTMKEITGMDFSIPPQGPPPAQLISYGY